MLSGRVLVADDNPTNQTVAVLLLQKFGCTASVAQNGREAVDLCAGGGYDAILMDCRMPVMDGLEATRLIRQSGSKIPIIALTAEATDVERKRCLEAGMDDYLSKPVRADELRGKLGQWMNGEASQQDAPAKAIREELASFIVSLEEIEIGWDVIDGLLASFLQTSATLTLRLEQAVRENDGPLTGATAHSLRGSLANFGFADLARLASVLETSGKSARWEEAGQALEEFLPKCRRARETVAEARRDGTK